MIGMKQNGYSMTPMEGFYCRGYAVTKRLVLCYYSLTQMEHNEILFHDFPERDILKFHDFVIVPFQIQSFFPALENALPFSRFFMIFHNAGNPDVFKNRTFGHVFHNLHQNNWFI